MCSAVLAWCRVRFVRFADNDGADTTLVVLAQCFEVLGGVPGSRIGWAAPTSGAISRPFQCKLSSSTAAVTSNMTMAPPIHKGSAYGQNCRSNVEYAKSRRE